MVKPELCGAPTKAGLACRRLVMRGGRHCYAHTPPDERPPRELRARLNRPVTSEEAIYLEVSGALQRSYRKAVGLSQEALAAMAGLAVFTIWAYENAQRRPRYSTLSLIAHTIHRRAMNYALSPAGRERPVGTPLPVPEPEEMTYRLALAAGPALAPESPRFATIQRNRDRRPGRRDRRARKGQVVLTYFEELFDPKVEHGVAERTERLQREVAAIRTAFERRRYEEWAQDVASLETVPERRWRMVALRWATAEESETWVRRWAWRKKATPTEQARMLRAVVSWQRRGGVDMASEVLEVVPPHVKELPIVLAALRADEAETAEAPHGPAETPRDLEPVPIALVPPAASRGPLTGNLEDGPTCVRDGCDVAAESGGRFCSGHAYC